MIIAVVALAVFNPAILMQVDDTIKQYAKPYVEQYISSESSILKPVGVTRDIARSADISALQAALLQYRLENDQYPDMLDTLVPVFIAENPKDPKTNKPYEYSAIDSGKSYLLCISFESKDKQGTCITPN